MPRATLRRHRPCRTGSGADGCRQSRRRGPLIPQWPRCTPKGRHIVCSVNGVPRGKDPRGTLVYLARCTHRCLSWSPQAERGLPADPPHNDGGASLDAACDLAQYLGDLPAAPDRTFVAERHLVGREPCALLPQEAIHRPHEDGKTRSGIVRNELEPAAHNEILHNGLSLCLGSCRCAHAGIVVGKTPQCLVEPYVDVHRTNAPRPHAPALCAATVEPAAQQILLYHIKAGPKVRCQVLRTTRPQQLWCGDRCRAQCRVAQSQRGRSEPRGLTGVEHDVAVASDTLRSLRQLSHDLVVAFYHALHYGTGMAHALALYGRVGDH